jgi:cytochrome c oxidase subunit 2
MGKRLFGLMVAVLIVSGALSFLFLKVSFLARPAGTEAESIDYLVRLLFSIGGAVAGLVMVVFVYSLVAFRRRKGDEADGAPLTGHVGLELVWTLVPLAIVVVLGLYGSVELQRMQSHPPDGDVFEVNVTAFQWSWTFDYPEAGVQSAEFHAPVNRPLMLNIISTDVVHSFWIPELGPKQDAVPGMTTHLRLTPTREGKFEVVCAELCGTSHAYMTAPAFITSQAEVDRWLEQEKRKKEQPEPTEFPSFATMAESGKDVFAANCAGCHGKEGEGISAPALIGPERQFAKYGSAKELLAYVSANMPAGRAGSLSRMEYYQVLSHLLMQNSEALAEDTFDPNKLGDVKLE